MKNTLVFKHCSLHWIFFIWNHGYVGAINLSTNVVYNLSQCEVLSLFSLGKIMY